MPGSTQLQHHLHSLEEIRQCGYEGCQYEEPVEGESRVELDILTNHFYGDGEGWPEVRVDQDVQEPTKNATPHGDVVDLGTG